MSLHIFTITLETERVEGKFASLDELRDKLVEELTSAVDGATIDGDEGGSYEVISCEVEHDDDAVAAIEKASKAARSARRREARKASPAPKLAVAHSFAATMSPEGCACGCGGRTAL